MQLATYSGWRLNGVRGGLLAGALFVLPGAIVMLALATIYALYGSVPFIAALFLGIKAAVLVIVIEALLRVAKKALHGQLAWALAGASFVALFFFAIPYPLIVIAAAAAGTFAFASAQDAAPPVSVRWTTTLTTAATWLAVWLVPVAILDLTAGTTVLPDIAAFFSRLAIVTFGGAYAVLAYMAQDVVAQKEWLTAGEMMDGLGLAETTPGPLILVTQFVGHLAAYREGGFLVGLAGAGVTLWVTFIPCFAWIFTGAPYIEWIAAQPRLAGALRGITAAVVGVILNLSIWFALHVLFATVERTQSGPLILWIPDVASLDWRVAALAVLSGILLLGFHFGLATVLGVADLGGLAFSWL